MRQLVSQRSCPVEQVLLRELNHRINNEFACAINTVSLAAARTKNDEVKRALSDVEELLHHYADVHRALRTPEHVTPVDAAEYLHQLCLSISRSKLDRREIRLVLVAQALWLDSDRCWRLGMIIHELINNAVRHAFAREKGEIRVGLARSGAFIECRVLNNGSAAASVQPGRGFKIINELVEGLEGRFEQRFGSRGSMFVVAFPYSVPAQIHSEIRSSGNGGNRRAKPRESSARDGLLQTCEHGVGT